MPGTPACPEKVRTFCLRVIHFDAREFFLLCFCLLTGWLACDVRCCIGTSPFPRGGAPKGRAQLLKYVHL